MYKDRRKWIGEQLAERPFISLDELFRKFPDVSQMTIRRDLDYFEKRGDAIKVRGGARSARFITMFTMSMRLAFFRSSTRNLST